MAKVEKKSFIFYCDWQEVLMDYPAEVRLEVYDAIIRYVASGTLSELKPLAKMAFSFIRKDIDANNAKYAQTVEKRRTAGQKGMRSRYGNDDDGQEPTDGTTKANKANKRNKTNKTNKTNKCQQGITNETTVTNLTDNDNVDDNVDDNNIVDVVEAREGEKNGYGDFLGQFFADGNQRLLETLCMQMHTDTATLRRLAADTIAEWQLTRQQHSDYTEMSKHLINQMRIKLKQDGTSKPNSAAKGEPGGVRQDAAPKRPLRSTI